MNRTQDHNARLRLLAVLLVVGAGVGAAVPAARGQGLTLPVPEVDLVVNSRRVVLTWQEIPETEGRLVPLPILDGFDPFSSDVDLVGEYVLDCDFRLTISKIPLSGFGVNVRLVYKLLENTTGVGAPFAIDTLDVFQPDVTYPFDPRLVGNLGLRFTTNITQPTDSLGTIPITISGLNTGLSQEKDFFVAVADSTGGAIPGALRVEVVGPFDRPGPPGPTVPDTILTVSAAGEVFPIMNGMEIAFGPGLAAPGDTVFWSVRYLFPPNGKIDADLEAFEGYHIWRSDLPDVERDFTLLGEIRPCDSKRDIVLLSEDELAEVDITLDYDPDTRVFRLADRDVLDDFPYRYAVSTFDREFLGNPENVTIEGELAKTPKVYPAHPARDPKRKAFVVPNPYKRSSPWEEGEPKVVFSNLPPECTIRIFNAATDYVATIRHGPNEPRSTSPTSTSWNLVSDAGQSIVPGIYIYYIEGTGSVSFQQTGKMIVVR